jgi:hypothetical protein
MGSEPDWTMVKPNQEVFNYVQQVANQAIGHLTDAAREVYDNSKEIYQAVNYSTAMRQARAVVRQLSNKSRTNEVMELKAIGELQNAPQIMQRFIMADPITRALYHNDECSGYTDSYVDLNPNAVGVSHYDYRRVMNGMWHEDTESGNLQMDVFYEDTDGDIDLDALGQMDIVRTWDYVRAALKHGKEDPTSPYNELL